MRLQGANKSTTVNREQRIDLHHVIGISHINKIKIGLTYFVRLSIDQSVLTLCSLPIGQCLI